MMVILYILDFGRAHVPDLTQYQRPGAKCQWPFRPERAARGTASGSLSLRPLSEAGSLAGWLPVLCTPCGTVIAASPAAAAAAASLSATGTCRQRQPSGGTSPDPSESRRPAGSGQPASAGPLAAGPGQHSSLTSDFGRQVIVHLTSG
jgi:hypothetical protein